MVALSVLAADPQGNFVRGLATEDFTVLEDGVRQAVSFFASMPAPIDLAILLDTSASVADKMTTVRQAATGFISALRSTDRVTIVGIKDAVRVLHPLNGDAAAARQAIVVLSDGEDTTSLVGLDDVMELAKRSGVAVYTITPRPRPRTGYFASGASPVANR